jgi:tol-pal system protein YbgF
MNLPMNLINRSLMGFILVGGLTIAPVSVVSAAAPVEDLTQQDSGGRASYNEPPEITSSGATPSTQGAGEARTFRPSSNSGSTPTTPTTPSRSSMSVEQRMNVLEQQVRNLAQQDAGSQLNRLQTEIDRLRGQVEVQDHTIKQLTEQLRTQYQDLDERLQSSGPSPTKKPAQAALPTAKPKLKPANIDSVDDTIDIPSATPAAKTPKKPAAQPAATADDGMSDPNAIDINSADTTTKTKDDLNPAASNPKDPQTEKQEYDTAIALLKKQDYVRATTQLQRYLRDYPKTGKYTASSHYWLGKIYSYQGQPDLAISEYNTIITNYPKDPKMPNALLELGVAYDEAGDWEQAKTQLNKVIKLFPKTETAQLAAARLQKIKRQGL